MSTRIIEHFASPETWHLDGNASIVNSGKFGGSCVYFPDDASAVKYTNISGVYNLPYSNTNCEMECFIKPQKAEEIQKAYLLENGCKFFEGRILKCIVSEYSFDWHRLEEHAQAMAGHLASATSTEKNAVIQELVDEYGGTVCLGGYFDNGKWTWTNGDKWKYTNWYDGYPVEDEPIIAVISGYDGKIFTYREDSTFNAFVCEWTSVACAYLALKGYRFFNGHTFKLSDKESGMTAEEAKTMCEELGGHIATCTSEEKNKFFAIEMGTMGYSDIRLGGSRKNIEDNWEWITGEEWNYTNWNDGSPDNENRNRLCLQLYYTGEDIGKWCDITSDYVCPCICEWDYDMRTVNMIPGLILTISGGLADINSTGYRFYDGHTFKIFKAEAWDWRSADALCKKKGGHLATVTSKEKATS